MNKNFLNDIILKLRAKGSDEVDVFYCESNNKNCSSRLGKIERKEWDKVSWEKVDNCNVRYIILPHK